MTLSKKKTNHRNWLNHLGFLLALAACFAIFAVTPFAQQLTSSTLDLNQNIATKAGVPAFKINANNNDALIDQLKNEKTGLVGRVVHIIKYVLGGVFMLFFALYIIYLITGRGEDTSIKEFKNSVVYALVGFLVFAIADPIANSFNLIGTNNGNLLTNPSLLRESAAAAGFSLRAAAKLIQYILGALALLFMGVSGLQIITAGTEEQEVKNARKSLVWATVGLVVAGVTPMLVDVLIAPQGKIGVSGSNLDPVTQHAQILELGRSSTRIVILKIVKYFQTFMGATAILMLFLAGFKMISAGSDENIIKKQQKMITWVFLGLALVLIAEGFVNVFMPLSDGLIRTPGLSQIGSFSAQMGGFTNFLLTFSGSLAVLSLVVGALFVTTAVANPEQAEKGKKILLGAALGLVITISAYALVNTVLSGDAEGLSDISLSND